MDEHQHLKQLSEKAFVPVERLESGVGVALSIMDSMKKVVANGNAERWLKTINDLEKLSIKTRTVVGVVGSTGAGKSSVINAILDEERLVPTNCMRACTAVVTELSWNENNDKAKKYRAEIEFIKEEDWSRELALLANDLLDAHADISRECYNPETDAGVAFAKIRAVYPAKKKQEIAKGLKDIPSMLSQPSLMQVLGTTITLYNSSATSFYNDLQRYIDSKEKTQDAARNKELKVMEYWPLIKVVRIYVRSPVLETGAVIVDLPGVHDSNAARAAVAQSYMKQCSGLWVVAPITRAVDDKAAKTLLGDSFKRQLKYDGQYSAVTFICSKTDDISVTEATDSLGLEYEISKKHHELQLVIDQMETLDSDIRELNESKKAFQASADDRDDQVDVWEELLDEVEAGREVYAPDKNRKRKHQGWKSSSKKRRAVDSGEENVASHLEESASDHEDSTQGMALTASDIKKKMAELKGEKKEIRKQKLGAEQKIREDRDKLKELKALSREINSDISAQCISGRNDYSKSAIKLDFAAGIKELDQETAAENNEENFNPDQDLRDYVAVADSLPVFCVSSRAYQKLSDRLKKDAAVPGFRNLKETEIPQLQAHCRKMTEANRASVCRLFLNNFSQFLTSFSLWASNSNDQPAMTEEQCKLEAEFLAELLDELEEKLDKAVRGYSHDYKEMLSHLVFTRFQDAIEKAAPQAPTIVSKRGTGRDDGGLAWATYKATVRRNGVYEGASGARDFNEELASPMTQLVVSRWEKAFQRCLPGATLAYIQQAKELLQGFQNDMETRAQGQGTGLLYQSSLANLMRGYEESFSNIATIIGTLMTEHQREANRLFAPAIQEKMLPAYVYTTAARGQGSYMVMKNHMSNYVEEHRTALFQAAADSVHERLDDMCKAIQDRCAELTFDIFDKIGHDYGQIINDNHVKSAAELALREECQRMICNVDDQFKLIVLDEGHVSCVDAERAEHMDEGGIMTYSSE